MVTVSLDDRFLLESTPMMSLLFVVVLLTSVKVIEGNRKNTKRNHYVKITLTLLSKDLKYTDEKVFVIKAEINLFLLSYKSLKIDDESSFCFRLGYIINKKHNKILENTVHNSPHPPFSIIPL